MNRRRGDGSRPFRPDQLSASSGALSKIRTFNTLAISSIESLFSSSPSLTTRKEVQEHEDGQLEEFEANLYNFGDGDLTPLALDYPNLRVEDYCAAKTLRFSSISGLLPSNNCQPMELPHSIPAETHTSSRFPEVRRLFGGFSRSRRVLSSITDPDTGSLPAMQFLDNPSARVTSQDTHSNTSSEPTLSASGFMDSNLCKTFASISLRTYFDRMN